MKTTKRERKNNPKIILTPIRVLSSKRSTSFSDLKTFKNIVCCHSSILFSFSFFK